MHSSFSIHCGLYRSALWSFLGSLFYVVTDFMLQQISELAAMLWWFTATPKPLKIQVFWGSPSPQGSQSRYILGDTTRPGHVTRVLV